MKTIDFIKKAKLIHGDKYDYSKVDYVDASTKVCIICPEHGEFWMTPHNHISKYNHCGCPICNGGIKDTKESFIKKAENLYGNKYNYNMVKYINTETPVCIICPEHGEFWMTPHYHLTNHICPECNKILKMDKTEDRKHQFALDFINKSKKLYKNKYNYDKVIYKSRTDKVIITCPEHGDFLCTPMNHLRHRGCPKCGAKQRIESKTLTQDEFIERAIKIHGDKYDYTNTTYVSYRNNISVMCHNTNESGYEHGVFTLIANSHLSGVGCPKCQESNYERIVRVFLENNNIKYEQYKRFNWMGLLSLDFFLPDYNIAIECQGEQHFYSLPCFGGEQHFNKGIKNDIKKYNLCKQHNIKILYYIPINNYEKYNIELYKHTTNFSNIVDIIKFL